MPRKVQKAAPAADVPPTLQTIAVKAIHALDDIQPRSFLSTQVIEEYATLYSEAEGEEPLPPLDVFEIKGKFYVSDGFHRLEAAKRASRQTLACHVHTGSRQDAMRHGAFANLRRGLVYSQQDRQRILERLLQDPQVSQRSNRDLAQALGLSHVTVGRARQRLATVASLEDEWRALPVTQTTEDAQRQEHIATFLQVDPTVVARYETFRREPLDTAKIISWVARTMTDSNKPADEAKTWVSSRLQQEVQDREHERKLRQLSRPKPQPKKSPEALALEQAEQARREREDYLCDHLTGFVGLLAGREATSWRSAYTLADMVQALSPKRRQEISELLSQAEAVIQALKDALVQHGTP